ncbi:MAG: nicotinamide-nucleotide adenylyltransferase [Candidatus Heimdallarchaeaceae archaeon]
MRALYLGRFNPPHLGHVKALEYILAQPDIEEVIILIGSGEKAYSVKNPFTGGERVEMMRAIIRHYFDLNNFYIIAIPDANRNTIWPAHVIDLVPHFEVIFTNNPLVIQLFNNLTEKIVHSIPLVNRTEYSGRIIREKMLKGEKWQHLVPEVILPIITRLSGVERIKAVSSTDEIGKGEENKAK